MIKIIFKSIALIFPFLIITIAVFFIDPYNYWAYSNESDKDLKINISKPLNDPLWKLIEYDKNPCENVLLGDSRMGAINSDNLSLESNYKFYNLSFGGANCNEIIKVLDYIIDKYYLKNIYIGLNLDQYNQSNNRERISGIVKIMNNPFLYLTNSKVLEASFLLMESKYSNQRESIKITPDVNKREFWIYQLDNTGSRYFSNYVYPGEYFNNLLKIKEKCKEKSIKFTIIIFPNHLDLNNLFDKFNLRGYESKFINDMKNLGDVYDFNFENPITIDNENFNDPFHCNKKIIDKIIYVIWGGDSTELNTFYKFYNRN